MFPLQPKVCLFIQNQKERKQSTKGKHQQNKQPKKEKHQNIKARKPTPSKKNNLFMYEKKNKRKQKFFPFLKF